MLPTNFNALLGISRWQFLLSLRGNTFNRGQSGDRFSAKIARTDMVPTHYRR